MQIKNDYLKNFQFISIEKLVKADWNYKLDDDDKKEKLKNNIKRNGQLENIIVRELDTGFFEIVNGNHRYDAFSELGYDGMVCYNCGNISLAQAKRIAIETNETKFASDQEKLALTIQEISLEFPEDDLKLTMPYSEIEFGELMSFKTEYLQINDPEIQEDDFDREPPAQPKSVRGDLYELNGHRLYCGDSTKPEDVALLMDGKLGHMLHTDPPYNINYAEFNLNRGTNKKNGKPRGKNWTTEYCSEWEDSMTDEDYILFLINFLKNAKANLIGTAHYYVWHASKYYREVLNAFETAEIPFDKVPIQWVKQVAPLSWARYKRLTEPCIFGGKGATNGAGNEARWFGPNNEKNVWMIDREHNGSYVHPTQKPLTLCARAIKNSSQVSEIVMELFGGSGSTLVASDQLDRLCYTMEYEPKFCDVIAIRFIEHCEKNNKPYTIKRNGELVDKSFFDIEV